MSDPKRGFDPLASLFDGPDLGEFTDPGSKTTGLRPEATDPLISIRADAPLDVLKGESEGPSPSDLPEPGLRPPSADAEQEAAAEDALHKAALARSLAKAAIARAAMAKAKAASEASAEAEQAQKARNEARARAAGAKAIAQARAAALKQAAAAKQATPKPAAPKARPASAPKGQVVSRLDGLATRARRPTSALEAARAAAAAEKQVRVDQAEEQAQAEARALPDKVDAILRNQLRGVERLKVGKALAMDDRELLRALWKAHRARFASQGALSDVVSTTRVIHALETVQDGQLVAAIVLTESSDYLVWIDLSSQTTIAAFRDARAWYAQAR